MADYGLAAQIGAGGGGNAFNPMQSMAQFQNMSNAMLQGQQLQQQMTQQNALRNILSQSGGKVTPEIIQGLVASGNYEPALALQRHQASMGSIGVQTQAAQTALEKARLELGETKRVLAAGAATRDFISKSDDLTNPDALKTLRQTNPDAYEAITKFNGLTAKMTHEAATAKRLDDKAKLELAQATMGLFAPALATAKTEDQFNKIYDRIFEVYPKVETIAPRAFTPDNVRALVQAGTNLQDLEATTVGGVPGVRNKRTNQFFPSEVGTLGANAPTPGQQTMVAPPVAPTAATPPGMAASMNATNMMGAPGAAPAAPANVMAAPPAQPQTMQQLLAAEKEGKLRDFRRQKEIEAELNPKGQLTEEQTLKLQKDVGNELADTRNTLAALDDTIKAARAVKSLSPGAKESITGPINARIPSTTEAALNAETKLDNLKGVVTRLGKEAASAGGAIGNMAVQEWKIVQNMIASLDTTKMNGKILDQQVDAIIAKAEAAAKRTKEAYNTTYKHAFEKFPGRFELESGGNPSDIDALLKKYL